MEKCIGIWATGQGKKGAVFLAFGTMWYHYFFCGIDFSLSSKKAFLYDLAIRAISFLEQTLTARR